MANYNKLERPVVNESDAVVLTFGLTLQQIIDVVSDKSFILTFLKCCFKLDKRALTTSLEKLNMLNSE